MRAIVFDRYGSADQLQLREVPDPQVGKDEVLVQIHAAGVNPVDWKLRSGHARWIFPLKLPFIPGCDLAGVVLSVGSNVSRFQAGEEVVGIRGVVQGGAYAERIAIAAESLARKPANLSFEETASLPVAGLSALQAIRDLGRLKPGGKVLVLGGSSGVGHFAVQVAKALHAGFVAATSGPDNLEFVRQLGADLVIDYRQEDVLHRPERYDVILDAVATSSPWACERIMTDDAAYVTTLPGPSVIAWNCLRRLRRQHRSAHQFFVATKGENLEALTRMIEAGEVKPSLQQVFPWEQAAESHRISEQGRVRGKLVLQIRSDATNTTH